MIAAILDTSAPATAATLKGCLDTWELRRARRGGCAPATAKQYRYGFRIALPLLSPRPSAAQFEVFREGLTAAGRSVASVNSILHSLQAVCSYAGKLSGDHYLSDQLACVRDLRVPAKRKVIPGSDVLLRILPACASPAERAFVLLACARAGRVGEVQGLIPADVLRGEDGAPTLVSFIRTRTADHRKQRGTVDVDLVSDPELAGAIWWTLDNRDAIVASLAARGGAKSSEATTCRLFPWSVGRTAELAARLRASLGADVDRYLPKGAMWHALRRAGAQAVYNGTRDPFAVKQLLGDTSAAAFGYFRPTPPSAPLPRPPVQVRLPGTSARDVASTPAPGAGSVREGDRIAGFIRSEGVPGGGRVWGVVPTVGAVAAGTASPEVLSVEPDPLAELLAQLALDPLADVLGSGGGDDDPLTRGFGSQGVRRG